MKYLFGLPVAALVVFATSSLNASDWERVYPLELPTWDELPLLSLNLDNGIGLVGSRDGLLLLGRSTSGLHPPFSYGEVEVMQTPATFDFLAIAYAREAHAMFFGGPFGQIAKASIPDGIMPFPYMQFDQLEWSFYSLPVPESVKSIFSLNDRIFTLAGDQVFQSMDAGETWQAVTQVDPCSAIMPFKGRLYALATLNLPEAGEGSFLVLQSTEGDGIWKEAWQVSSGTPIYTSQYPLAVFIERFDGLIHNDKNPEARLYAFANTSDTMGSITGSLAVSTSDGEHWLDHNSYKSTRCPMMYGCTSPWNPLNLPDSERFVPITIQSYGTTGMPYNYRIRNAQSLDFYSFREWEPFLESKVNHRALGLNITQWDSILFNDFSEGLFMIETAETGSSVSSLELPEELAEATVLQIETAAGVTYLSQKYPADEQRFYSIYASEDLETWERLYYGLQEQELVPFGNDMIRMDRTEMNLLSDNSTIVQRRPMGSHEQFTYHPQLKTLFYLTREEEQVIIKGLQPDGELAEFARTNVESSASYFTRLVCPDGETLIAYGNSAEMAIIEADGSIRLAHPWKYFTAQRYFIRNIRFINGWYYIIGHVLLRTRDFATYEYVGLGEARTTSTVRDIREQDGFLHLFTDDVIYRRELERGFLDSIEHNLGWRESDWLGWFKVVDESQGRIEHLLFGQSTIHFVADSNYIMHTEALGEVRLRTDWMPWFEQMETGTWFWLDRAAWPPRAWNGTTEEWIPLLSGTP